MKYNRKLEVLGSIPREGSFLVVPISISKKKFKIVRN
jgi:hypothetical protein